MSRTYDNDSVICGYKYKYTHQYPPRTKIINKKTTKRKDRHLGKQQIHNEDLIGLKSKKIY